MYILCEKETNNHVQYIKNVILVSAVLDVVNVFFSYDNRGRLSWCLNSLAKDGHAWCHKLIASVCCV